MHIIFTSQEYEWDRKISGIIGKAKKIKIEGVRVFSVNLRFFQIVQLENSI